VTPFAWAKWEKLRKLLESMQGPTQYRAQGSGTCANDSKGEQHLNSKTVGSNTPRWKAITDEFKMLIQMNKWAIPVSRNISLLPFVMGRPSYETKTFREKSNSDHFHLGIQSAGAFLSARFFISGLSLRSATWATLTSTGYRVSLQNCFFMPLCRSVHDI